MNDIERLKEEQSLTERAFEGVLWSGRWAVLLAVVGGMLTATIMFYIAAVDVYYLVELIFNYASLSEMGAREALRAEGVGHAVEIIDGFLLAIVLLIFSYGIYELYISRIDQAYEDESAQHLLKINNLDDLKSRLGKVILMILVVKFFEVAVSMHFQGMMDLLMFAVAVILIGITLFMNQLVEYFVHDRHARTSGFDGGSNPGRRSRDRASDKAKETSQQPASDGEVSS